MKPAVSSPWRVLSTLVHLPETLCPSHRWLQIVCGGNKGHIICACCHGELLQLAHGASECLRPFRGRPWHHFHPVAEENDVEHLMNEKDVKLQQSAWVCCQCDTKVAFEVASPVVPVGIWEALSARQHAVALLKMLLVYQRDFLQETPRKINAENTRFKQFMTAEGYPPSLLYFYAYAFLWNLIHDHCNQSAKRY
jgi:hypothetical protein